MVGGTVDGNADDASREEMLLVTEEVAVGCPYCGENIRVVVDLSVVEQEYVEDCSVCCRPIVLYATVNQGSAEISARTEDD